MSRLIGTGSAIHVLISKASQWIAIAKMKFFDQLNHRNRLAQDCLFGESWIYFFRDVDKFKCEFQVLTFKIRSSAIHARESANKYSVLSSVMNSIGDGGSALIGAWFDQFQTLCIQIYNSQVLPSILEAIHSQLHSWMIKQLGIIFYNLSSLHRQFLFPMKNQTPFRNCHESE